MQTYELFSINENTKPYYLTKGSSLIISGLTISMRLQSMNISHESRRLHGCDAILKLPPTKSMADASGTSRPRREITTASSTSWCSDSSGSGISTAAVATPAWRNDEVGFRNRTGSCNTPQTHARSNQRPRGQGSWNRGSVLGSRMEGARTAPWGPGCRAPWRGRCSCAQPR